MNVINQQPDIQTAITLGEAFAFSGINLMDETIVVEALQTDEPIYIEYDIFGEQLQKTTSAEFVHFDELQAPMAPRYTCWLNHPLLRQRGLREADRVQDWVQPLTMMEKMAILPHLGMALPPMQLLGLAESHVLSECQLKPDVYLVCHRLRFAIAMSSIRHDTGGFAYDYDTVTCHVMHTVNFDEIPSYEDIFQAQGYRHVQSPVDCLVFRDRLFVLDSKDAKEGMPSMGYLNIWRLSS